MKNFVLIVCALGFAAIASAQAAPPAHISAVDAKSHVGETGTVCGKVVDTKVPKYGIAGHGKPVSFDLDQPEPNAVFYFVAFGTGTDATAEVIAAYNDKRVCVTGKITASPSNGPPFILAADRNLIKAEAPAK